MKPIKFILHNIDKLEDIFKVLKALLDAVDTFTQSLKKHDNA